MVIDPEPSSGAGSGRGGSRSGARWPTRTPAPVRALVHDAGLVGIDLAAVERRTGLREAGTLLRSMSEGKGAVLVPLPGDRWVHAEAARGPWSIA